MVESLALVQNLHLQELPPLRLRLAAQAKRQMELLVAAVGVLEGVDAGLHQRELDLVDLIARETDIFAERRGLSRRDDLHLRCHRNGHRNLTAIRHGDSRRSGSSVRHETARSPRSAGRVAVTGSRRQAVYRRPPSAGTARARPRGGPIGGWAPPWPRVRLRWLSSSLRAKRRARP